MAWNRDKDAPPARTDVAVAGGGPAGLAAALALAGPADRPSGLKVAVLDAAPARGGDARASAVTAASRRMLARLGAWTDTLEKKAWAVTAMEITDSRAGDAVRPQHLTFDTGGGGRGGAPAAIIVPNGALVAALEDAVGAHPAIVHATGCAVSGFSATGAGARAATQRGEVSARLIVAADGAASYLRALAGIKTVGWDYDQTGIVATLRLERDHGGVAVQHFLPAGPFAMLPLPDRRASLVWSEDKANACALLALAPDAFIRETQRRLGRRFGALELVEGPQGFALSFLAARDIIAPRLALVGDAAHRFHPLAGLGLNMGLRDAAALAETVLDAARLGLDVGSLAVLERYRRWRRFDAAALGVASDGLNRLFSNDLDALRALRDAGLGIVERLPALKRAFVSEAAGDTGTLPRLLKGEAA